VKIGIDVDGIVYNWEAQFRALLIQYHGVTLPISEEFNSIQNQCTREQWKDIWNNHPLELFIGGDYYRDARGVVAELVYQGHEVYFVSATPSGTIRQARARKLLEDFSGIYGVYFINPGEDNKTVIECDVYLDDKLETAQFTAIKGYKSFLMDRPWNQMKLSDATTRIYTWKQFLEEVNNARI
jgi:uncharacterized protein